MKIENSDVVIFASGGAGLICALSLSKKFKKILSASGLYLKEVIYD